MGVPELSLDILVLIVKQVDVKDRRTLLCLCRACKSLNAIASQRLYSNLDIRLDGKSKSDDVALIRRVIQRGYAKSVVELKVKGDRLVEPERPQLKRTSTLEVKTKLSISMLIDTTPSSPLAYDAPDENREEKQKEEPLLELMKQCSKLRRLKWGHLSESYETIRAAAALLSLKEVELSFRRPKGEALMPCDDLALKTFAFDQFKDLSSLDLLMVSGEAVSTRSALVDVLFKNPKLKRLAISLDIEWDREREYSLELEDEGDERLGASPFWLRTFIEQTRARMKKEHKHVLLENLEELELLEGLNLSDDGDINLQEIINLSKLRSLRYDNTPQFESTYEAPENYDCFREHATSIEYVHANTVTNKLIEFVSDLPNVKKLSFTSPPEGYGIYNENELETLMDSGLQVECDSWDVGLWYKNRKERGGDPYGAFY